MIILGIDTSSTDLSVCLCIDGSLVSTVNRYVRNSHAEHIAQAVKTTLELGGVDVDQVTRIAVSTGPGSFTGLRIGLSFIKGMCLMTDRKVLPLSSLMVLAHAVNSRQCRQGRIFTALDARQGRIHWAGFACVDGDGVNGNNGVSNINKKHTIQRLTDDRLSSPNELMDELSSDDILVTDTMGYPRSTVFGAFEGKAEIINAENSALARAHSCASLAYCHGDDGPLWQSANVIVPNYLQMSAAEEKKASCS